MTERKGADGRPSVFISSGVSDSVRDLIGAYDDAWNRQDLDALCAFHADDVVFANHTAGEVVEGPTRFVPTSAGSSSAGRRCASAGGASTRPTTSRSASGRRPRRATTAREIEWDGVDVFPIRDGKIARKDIYSSSHAPRVLG